METNGSAFCPFVALSGALSGGKSGLAKIAIVTSRALSGGKTSTEAVTA